MLFGYDSGLYTVSQLKALYLWYLAWFDGIQWAVFLSLVCTYVQLGCTVLVLGVEYAALLLLVLVLLPLSQETSHLVTAAGDHQHHQHHLNHQHHLRHQQQRHQLEPG